MYRLAVFYFVFGAVSLSQAQLTYAKIDVPSAVATEARGINNFGEIVGFYKTVMCRDYEIEVPNCYTKGFKYVKGTFTRLMVPNSVSTAILGVNDLGDLVGFYTKSDGSHHGFIWYHKNVVKTIDFPNPLYIARPRPRPTGPFRCVRAARSHPRHPPRLLARQRDKTRCGGSGENA